MNKKILIFGKGFLGTKLYEALNCDITSGRIKVFDDAQTEVEKYKPDVIINCIGYTGERNVDDCEKDKNKTLLANTFVPIILGEIAYRNNIKLVHLSTGCIYYYDYVYQTPITEDFPPDYFNLYYSRSKIYAEAALRTLFSKTNILITRLRIPLDNEPHPKNILTKLLSFEKIIDVPNSVTYVPDFIQMIKHLIDIDAQGIYNAVNKGALRYQELLDVYKKYQSEYDYKIMDYEKFGLVRTNLVMSVEKLEKTGFKVRDIHEVIEECIQKYLAHSSQ